MVVHACNPSTQKPEAEESEVVGQPGFIARPCLKNKHTNF
jgi:hypothetical protein